MHNFYSNKSTHKLRSIIKNIQKLKYLNNTHLINNKKIHNQLHIIYKHLCNNILKINLNLEKDPLKISTKMAFHNKVKNFLKIKLCSGFSLFRQLFEDKRKILNMFPLIKKPKLKMKQFQYNNKKIIDKVKMQLNVKMLLNSHNHHKNYLQDHLKNILNV